MTLDFGDSIKQNTAIGPILGERIPVTAFLLLYSVAISIVVAVPLAIVSALRRNRAADHLIRLFSMVTFAMPSFLLGAAADPLLQPQARGGCRPRATATASPAICAA